MIFLAPAEQLCVKTPLIKLWGCIGGLGYLKSLQEMDCRQVEHFLANFGKNFQNNPNSTDLARFIPILAHCGQLSYTGLTGGLKTSAVRESWAERLFGKLNESCSPRQNHVIHLSSIRFSELKRPA